MLIARHDARGVQVADRSQAVSVTAIRSISTDPAGTGVHPENSVPLVKQ